MNRRVVLTRLREAATAAACLADQHPTEPGTRTREAAPAQDAAAPGGDRFTARVYGHGLVSWTPEDIDRYADRLHARHAPHRAWVPGRAPTCTTCAVLWPCPPFQWAEQWLSNVTRAEAE